VALRISNEFLKWCAFVLVLLFLFLSACLGTHRTPAFIAEVGIKLNELALEKMRLSDLPKGDWDRLVYQDPIGNGLRANVLGNQNQESLHFEVRRKGVIGAKTSLLIRDSNARLLGTIQPIGYLTFFQVTNVDGDAEDEIILYSYPSPTGKTMEIVNGDGSLMHRWDTRTVGRFDVMDWQGKPCILTPERDSFAITALDGELLGRLDAPYAHQFPRIVGKQLASETGEFGFREWLQSLSHGLCIRFEFETGLSRGGFGPRQWPVDFRAGAGRIFGCLWQRIHQVFPPINNSKRWVARDLAAGVRFTASSKRP